MPFHNFSLGGGVVRSRSKSSWKHKHSIEYTHQPRHRCVPVLDGYPTDSDSDCDCGNCVPVHRGRRKHRDAPLVEVNAYEGCRGRSRSRSHSRSCVYVVPQNRSRSRYIIPAYDDDDDDELFDPLTRRPLDIPGLQQIPRFRHGECCIHGNPWFVACESCIGRIGRCWPHAGPRYRLIKNDDGKFEAFDTGILWKKAKETVEKVDEAEKVKKQSEEKKFKQDIEDVKKLLKGYQGYFWPPDAYRSADDIREELAQLNADLKQCRSRATTIARMNAAINEEEVRKGVADCDGLLEADDDITRIPIRQGKVLKSMLKNGKGCVKFVEVLKEKSKARIEDMTDG